MSENPLDSSLLPGPQVTPRSHRISTVICWTAILLTVGFVGASVNLAPWLRGRAGADSAGSAVDPGLQIAAKYSVGAARMLSFGSGQSDVSQRESLVRSVESGRDDFARLHAAIVAGELLGGEAAVARLERSTPRDPHLQADHALLLKLYREGRDSLDHIDEKNLADRYGWTGKLAATFGQPDDDPARREVLGAARRAMLAVFGLIIGGLLAGVAGIALLIVAIVKLAQRRLRPAFAPVDPAAMQPAPRPPVFLEAFAIYIVGFVLCGIALHVIWKDPPMSMSLAATILLPIALVWPVLRGVSWRETALAFGWHRGRGVLREVFAGVIGYLAALPILAIAFFVMLALIRLSGARPSHPITDELQGPRAQVLLLFFIASVWAPVMEETMFRGALYNHLRRRWHWLVSSIVVGLIFAVVHPQGWTTVPLLAAIGMVLAWIREWRGSIIAPMTAHALSNGVVVTLNVLLLR